MDLTQEYYEAFLDMLKKTNDPSPKKKAKELLRLTEQIESAEAARNNKPWISEDEIKIALEKRDIRPSLEDINIAWLVILIYRDRILDDVLR